MIRKDETAQKEEFVNALEFFKGALTFPTKNCNVYKMSSSVCAEQRLHLGFTPPVQPLPPSRSGPPSTLVTASEFFKTNQICQRLKGYCSYIFGMIEFY